MKAVFPLGGAIFLTLLMTIGCGGQEFAVVDGYVTLDGHPLSDVEIVFIPDVTKGTSGNNASAFTDSNGYYRLQAGRDHRAGTILGIHRVVIIDLSMVVDLTRSGLPGAGSGVDAPLQPGTKPRRFPVQYGDLFSTPFQEVKVTSGQQSLNFEVHATSKPKSLPRVE